MSIVRVKTKYQVTLPPAVREKVSIDVGDILEAKVEKGRITLTPKSVIDRELDEALADLKAGRVSPLFRSAESTIGYLRRHAKSQAKKK